MLGSSWLQEYDELAADVENSTFQTFVLNVQRWADFIDDNSFVHGFVYYWESGADFNEWYAENYSSGVQMDGAGVLDWPADAMQRLGLQMTLFRKFGTAEINYLEFARVFFWTKGDFNAHTRNLVQQLFRPFQREMRRKLQKDLSNPPRVAPASDRIVPLTHNSDAYHDLVEALDKLATAVAAINDYPAPTMQDRHVAELSAGRRLLNATYARVEAVLSVLRAPLQWLAKEFAEKEIGHLADKAWSWLMSLLGFGP